MRSPVLIFLFVFAVGIGSNCKAQVWTQLPDAPDAGGGYSFVIGNEIYFHTIGHFFAYNTITRQWASRNSFPEIVMGRQKGVAFSANGKGYMGLGIDLGKGADRMKKDLWEYDPVADNWTRKTDIPVAARQSAGCFVINNKAYIGGGYSILPSVAYFKDLWEYDPAADKWTQKADLPVSNLIDPIAFSGDGKGYFTCGINSYQNFSNATYEYDPITDTWLAKADFPGTKRYSGTAFVLDNIAYVGTGATTDSNNNTATVSNDMYAYNIMTDTWEQKGLFPGVERWNAISAVINDKVYFGTGSVKMGLSASKDWWELIYPLCSRQNYSQTGLEVFPNPANDLIKVQLNGMVDKSECRYKLFNMAGEEISSGMIRANRTIPIQHVSSGNYFLKIINGGCIYTAKIEVVH